MKVEEIKKLFRGIRSIKKEMELRLAFLKDVQQMEMDTSSIEASVLKEYARLEERVRLADRMLEVLDPQEREILVARYYKGVRWEYMEPETMYSISQCQRIHDRALLKLTSFCDGEVPQKPVKAGAVPVLLKSQ